MPIAIIADVPDDDEDCSQQHMRTGSSQHTPGSSSSMSSDSVRAQRELDGRCGDCGLQTHKMHVDPLTRGLVRVPLTIAREVHRGRCLFCYPISPHNLLSHDISCVASALSATCSGSDVYFHQEQQSRPGKRRVSQQELLHHHNNHQLQLQQQILAIIQGPSFDTVDILMAMSRVPHDVVVQEHGCERLWVLSWEDDYAGAIGLQGGIAIILGAMARFPHNAHLQQCACECLQNLSALNDFNCREICVLSGVHLIVAAMARHATMAGIQQCGCTALASIASGGSSSYLAMIEQAHGLTAVMTAARNFCDEESVIQAAYDALTAMGYDTGAAGQVQRMATPSPEEEQITSDQEQRSIVCMDL